MAGKDKDNVELFVDENGQISFQNPADNYFPVASDYGKIPNRFIERYGNISYLANLGMMLSIQNLTERHKEMYAGTMEGAFYEKIYKSSGTDFSDGLVACVPIQQFIRLYGLNSGGRTYSAIDSLYNGTILKNQWQILYEDKDVIVSTAVLTGTMYNKADKCMYMKFNPDLKPILMNIQRDYAQISLPVLGKLREDYITNMYQLFKKRYDFEQSKCATYRYASKWEVRIEFEIEHFFFISGLYPVDLTVNDTSMQKVITLLKAQDYKTAAGIMRSEGLVEKYAEEPSRKLALSDFNYFKRHYLDRAFKRINGFTPPKRLERVGADGFAEAFAEYAFLCKDNHPTDIHFRYELVRSGKGGRTSGLNFYVSRADWSEYRITKPDRTAGEQEDGEKEGSSLTSEQEGILGAIQYVFCKDPVVRDGNGEMRKINREEAAVIAADAGWDTEKIVGAITYTLSHRYEDFMAYIRTVIRNGYHSPENTEKTPYEQRYDIKDIKAVLNFETCVSLTVRTEKGVDGREVVCDRRDTLENLFSIICDTLNTRCDYISLSKDEKVDSSAVKERLLSLTPSDITDALESIMNAHGSDGKTATVSKAYVLKVLYNSPAESGLTLGKALQSNEGIRI